MALTTVAGTDNNIVMIPNSGDVYESITESLLYEIWKALITKFP